MLWCVCHRVNISEGTSNGIRSSGAKPLYDLLLGTEIEMRDLSESLHCVFGSLSLHSPIDLWVKKKKCVHCLGVIAPVHHTHTHTRRYTHTHRHTHTQVYTRTQSHTHTHMIAHMHTHTHTRRYTHTVAHTHTHAQ